jgi:hypothetical protein
MVEIITSLMLWIAAATGWPIPDHPNITYIEDEHQFFMMSQECDTKPNQPICETYDGSATNILALYNHLTKTIYLNKEFWWASVRDQSILLHELVHHMQYSRDSEFYSNQCKGDIEKEAYDLQEKWLEKRGRTLYDTIELGPLFRHILTRCDFF